MVDGLEHKTKGRLTVFRFNTEDDESKELAARYRVSAVPMFVLLDRKGQVVWSIVGKTPEYESLNRWLSEQKK